MLEWRCVFLCQKRRPSAFGRALTQYGPAPSGQGRPRRVSAPSHALSPLSLASRTVVFRFCPRAITFAGKDPRRRKRLYQLVASGLASGIDVLLVGMEGRAAGEGALLVVVRQHSQGRPYSVGRLLFRPAFRLLLRMRNPLLLRQRPGYLGAPPPGAGHNNLHFSAHTSTARYNSTRTRQDRDVRARCPHSTAAAWCAPAPRLGRTRAMLATRWLGAALAVLIAVAFATIVKPFDLWRRFRTVSFPPPSWDPDYVAPRVVSRQDLAEKFNGEGWNPSYLVVLGEAYDVTGSEHYKGEGGYSIFVGRDASTAFVTGKFDEAASDDVLSLDPHRQKGVEDWVKFYRNHKTYKFVGVIEGRFYDAKGRRTQEWVQVREKMDQAARESAIRESNDKKTPPCNSRWSQAEGTVFWCEDSMRKGETLGSPLVPRKRVETDGTASCACVEWSNARAAPDVFQSYDGCDGSDQLCNVK